MPPVAQRNLILLVKITAAEIIAKPKRNMPVEPAWPLPNKDIEPTIGMLNTGKNIPINKANTPANPIS